MAIISKKIVAIIKANGVYTVRYEVKSTHDVSYALPVYTGSIAPNGTIAKSRVLKKVVDTIKVKIEETFQAVTEGEAKVIHEALEFGKPQETATGWVVYTV